MKKLISSVVGILALLVVANISVAQVKVVDQLAISATGQSQSMTLPAKAGCFWNLDLTSLVVTGGNISVYCAVKATSVAVVSSGGTSLSIYTTASNVLEGVSITTDDFVLIDNAGTYTLANISATGTYVSGVSEYTVGAFTAAVGAKAYLCKLADILTIPVKAADAVKKDGIVVGKLGMPMQLVTGALTGADAVYVGVGNAMKP